MTLEHPTESSLVCTAAHILDFSTQTGKFTQNRAELNYLPDSSHAVLTETTSPLVPSSHSGLHGTHLLLPS